MASATRREHPSKVAEMTLADLEGKGWRVTWDGSGKVFLVTCPRRRAGRVDAIHPAFLVLGGTAGLVHQLLDANEARGAEVAWAARLSPSATSAALRSWPSMASPSAAAADGDAGPRT